MDNNQKGKRRTLLKAPFKKLLNKYGSSRAASPDPSGHSDARSSTMGSKERRVPPPLPWLSADQVSQPSSTIETSGAPLTATPSPGSTAHTIAVPDSGTAGPGVPSEADVVGGFVPAAVDYADKAEDVVVVDKDADRLVRKAGESGAGQPTEEDAATASTEPTKLQRAGSLAYTGVKESLRVIVRFTDAVPVVSSAIHGILEVFDRYDAVTGVPGELRELKEKLDALADILANNKVSSIHDRLSGLARVLEEKTRVINMKLERNIGARIIESTDDADFLSREIRSITFAVEMVMTDVNLKTNAMVSDLHHIALLDKLKYVEGAGFDREDRQGCANGTRMLLLADLLTWATESDSEKSESIFWLNGMAGTGKTTVSKTLCSLLSGRGILGSSFFCSRKFVDRRKINLIMPSLACALAYKYPEFQTELVHALQNCLDPTALDLENQYSTLLAEPAKIAFAHHTGPVILAVDALDECEDQQAAENFLKIILREQSAGCLRFFVTSRPETKIRKGFSAGTHAGLRLQDIEEHIVKADIRVYLQASFEQIEDLQSEYDGQWPPAELDVIVEKSRNLFIYAATAVKYISDDRGDPVERLQKYASITPPRNAVEAIDEVYMFVLKDTFSKLDADEQHRIQLCLQTVVCAFEPLSVSMYSTLLGISVIQVRRAFASLHSVVQMPEEKKNDLQISLYHASFPDYLTSALRTSGASWYIDNSSAHSMLASQCLKVMVSKLHFNIANATTSYKSNEEQGLTIPSDLAYTSVAWLNHIFLSGTDTSDKLQSKIEEFLLTKFLYWLEVLSVIDEAHFASAGLSLLYKITHSSTLKNICRQFATFISNHLPAIRKSVPHIYLSALPWASSDSIIGKSYLPQFTNLPKIVDSEADLWEPLVTQLLGHASTVTHVAYFPNGKYIASTSWDKTIRVWDTETGKQLWKNVDDRTLSIVVTPDSKYVVSCNLGGYIKIWDAMTGKHVGSLKENYPGTTQIAISSNGKMLASITAEGPIEIWDYQKQKSSFELQPDNKSTCVAFSPNSELLASGSGTNICIWNLQTRAVTYTIDKSLIHFVAFSPNGQSILSAHYKDIFIWDLVTNQETAKFNGHSSTVLSASYSCNERYIISVGYDQTARIWDVATQKEIFPALNKGSEFIYCCAFSPTSLSVAFGSGKTVQIWYTEEGLSRFENLTDHTSKSDQSSNAAFNFYGQDSSWISSIKFLPDNETIASGSWDGVVRVWDATTGIQKFHPLEGHTAQVLAITCSPDGKLIATGSTDGSMILWNANTGAQEQVLTGHTGNVSCLDFSQDSKHIASGSSDGTVRIWDMETSWRTLSYLDDKQLHIAAVAYFPDGKHVASAYSSLEKCKVIVWNIEDSTVQKALQGDYNYLTDIAVSPNGKYLACPDTVDLIFWDISTDYKEYRSVKPNMEQSCMAISSDSQTAIIAGKCEISTLNFESGEFSLFDCTGQKPITAIASSSDMKYIAAGSDNGTVIVYNHKLQECLESHFLHNSNLPINTMFDGWCIYADIHLYLWISPNKVPFVYTPNKKTIIAQRKITVDISNFHAHGENWVTCGSNI